MIAIIGSGPAGISTALYLKRANKDVVVFTYHKSSLLKAKEIDNYYGTGSISGIDLYEEGFCVRSVQCASCRAHSFL